GFDNPPCTISQHLPLTSVALPRYELGKLADELLHFEINKGTPIPILLHRVPCYRVQRFRFTFVEIWQSSAATMSVNGERHDAGDYPDESAYRSIRQCANLWR